MKAIIRLSQVHKYAGMYSVEYKKGKFYYYHGIESLKKDFINNFEGEIEFEEHPVFKEHSGLLKIIKERNKNKTNSLSKVNDKSTKIKH